MRDWPVPKNISELRSYLGMVSYYRIFILGYANIAAPLHRLLGKSSVYEWGPEQMIAFCTLKERLISAPKLEMPTDTGMFLLDSDASSVGLGAVISQIQDGKEVVIAYASRSLSDADRNYDTTERELLSCSLSRSDCGLSGSICWVGNSPPGPIFRPCSGCVRRLSPMAQMARWLAYIEQFDFEIQHRAGSKHGNADGLSRTPTHEDAYG